MTTSDRVRRQICGCGDYSRELARIVDCDEPARYFRLDGDGTGFVCAYHALTVGRAFPLGLLCDRPS